MGGPTRPTGTVSFFQFITPQPGFTNMASSFGFPFTTGMVTISAPAALGAELFVITGMDNRNVQGSGTIQLVAGALSQRTRSGPNANRGWIKLVLERGPVGVPALSPAALAATAGLMLLAAGYAMRRRFSA
jgi:hypothetical protein